MSRAFFIPLVYPREYRRDQRREAGPAIYSLFVSNVTGCKTVESIRNTANLKKKNLCSSGLTLGSRLLISLKTAPRLVGVGKVHQPTN